MFNQEPPPQKKRGNAVTCPLVADATVIVVDPETTGGRELVQSWALEAEKVVVSLPWLYKSVKRGKAFVANENWGGYRICEIEGSAPK